MQQLAPDLYLLTGATSMANIYLAGDVLFDAGTRFDAAPLLRCLRGHPIRLHALTHAHPDHQGASADVCRTFGVPLCCGAPDAAAMEAGTTAQSLPLAAIHGLAGWIAGPPYPVSRRLHEGDLVGDFTVIATPGHTPGHVSYWREADRTLILGDVLAHVHPLLRTIGLREPLPIFTVDIAANRRSARAVTALRPRLVCFGHGPPLRDPGLLEEFVAALPGG